MIPLILTATVLLLSPAYSAASFGCSAAGHCQSYLDYRPNSNVTLGGVRALFQLRSFRSLLAANSLPLSTPTSFVVTEPVRVPFPCSCSGRASSYGVAAAGHWPVYEAGNGDKLDFIARNVFAGLVTYQDIAAANNISADPNLVPVGKKLWIPLPCSCDDVEGEKVVHYAHVVKNGSSVDSLAQDFGVKGDTLMRLNGIANAEGLKVGQVLDVPLRVCSSSISNNSLDYGLKAPNGSYVITANNCVICSCSSSTWQLDCHPTQGISTSTCPVATCGGLNLGNTSSSSVCESATCSYAGYTNSTTFTILTNLTTQALCSTVGAPLPHPSGASVLNLGSNWAKLLVAFIGHMVFVHSSFLKND